MAGRSADPTRLVLGVTTLALGSLGAWQWATGNPFVGGFFVRSSIMAGAVWLVYPSMKRLRWWSVLLAAAAVAVVVLRPMTAWVLAPTALWMLRQRHRAKAARRAAVDAGET